MHICLQLNCRYLQLNFRYLQLNCRYLQINSVNKYENGTCVFTFIHWIADICNWIVDIFNCCLFGDNNNNTGYLLHAISPKSKEHIACYKHYNKLQIHCCKTLLRNIVTVTEHWQNISPTHPAVQQLIKDWGKQMTLTTDTFKQLVDKTEKVCFSSGSESRDIIRRAGLLRKRVPSRMGGIW